ncbi:YgfB and YecA protein [Thiomicrospira aerophila AL3]|uniref:YgfB and YecA protein n=2 Tax=Thiomicrospira aerophila TaxID=92245 RepID=W0DV67_9GAMM|nr:YgfB and YecA protein [Thiomicrospira aerophila AL3]
MLLLKALLIVTKDVYLMSTKLDFDHYNQWIAPISQLESPAFVQGLMIGQICADTSLTEALWLKQFLTEAGITKIKESWLHDLHQLYEQTLLGLNSDAFELELLLPDDTSSLAQRVHHLALWSEGVLHGLGLGQLPELNTELTELIQDLSELAMVAPPEDADDMAEEQYMQLYEFARLAAMMFYDQLHPMATKAPAKAASDAAVTLH